MPTNREPWVKVKIGLADSEKLAALPDDSARWGYVRLLMKAKTQRRMGVFGSRTHVEDVLGRHGAYFDAWRDVGLIHVAPALCGDCAGRHAPDQLRAGEVVLHHYLLEQRDPTNADRQGTWRKLQTALQALEAAGIPIPVTDSVTAHVTLHSVSPVEASPVPPASPVTPASVTSPSAEPEAGPVTPKVTPHSRARGTTVTVTRETKTTTKKNGLEEGVGGNSAREVAADAPKWRTPCRDYVHHQRQHRLIDGQAVCEPCEAEAAGQTAAVSANGAGQGGLGLV